MPVEGKGPKRRRASYKGAACPHCNRPLSHDRLNNGVQTCLSCGREFEAVCFTPPEVKTTVAQVAESGPDGAIACASHARNAAVGNCERCGAFICELCRIEADNMVLCPACFDRLNTEGALESTATRIKDYGRMASNCAAVGLLVWFASFILGPMAVGYAIKGLRQKKRMGESDGVVSLWIALVVGVLDALIGLFLLVAIFGAML